MTTGAITINEAAISNVQSVVYKPWNEAKPTGSVFISIEFVTIRGHMKLFQLPKNVKVANVAKAGFDKGRIIFQ
jgi:hypothetical protein